MRNALYARQSLDKKDSISIETQLEKGRAECAPADVILIYADRGFSGKNTKRPEFRRLMADVERDLIDQIIVYKLDRFSRSVLDFTGAWEILEKHRVQFVSINEKFDTGTPLGKAMLYIAIVFAQMERETIAERVRDNYYERLKRGGWMGGPAPYGFKIGRQSVGAERSVPSLLPQSTLAVVREIFEAYGDEQTASLSAVADWLGQRGIPGPKRVTWNNVTLARILKNPVYVKADADIYTYFKNGGIAINNPLTEFNGISAGMLVGKRENNATFTLANWAGTVPSDVWLTCQQKLAANEQIGNTGRGKYTWLSGLLKCGSCKRTFRVIVDRRYPAKKKLYCSGRADRMCTCRPQWEVSEVEKAVGRELADFLTLAYKAMGPRRRLDDEAKGGQTFSDHNASPASVPLKDGARYNQPPEAVLPELVSVMTNEEKISLQEIKEKTANLLANLTQAKIGDTAMRYINDELERLEEAKQKLIGRLQKKALSEVSKYEYGSLDFFTLDMAGKKIVAQNCIQSVLITEEEIIINWQI